MMGSLWVATSIAYEITAAARIGSLNYKESMSVLTQLHTLDSIILKVLQEYNQFVPLRNRDIWSRVDWRYQCDQHTPRPRRKQS
jgi:hypothetical protein